MIHGRAQITQTAGTADLGAVFVSGFLISSLVYTLMFNHLDDGTRTSIAGLLGIAALMRCAVSWPNPAAVTSTFLMLALLTVPISYYLFAMDVRDQNAAKYASDLVRMGTCLAVLLVFANGPRVISPRLLVISIVLIASTAMFVAITGQPVEYAGTLRPASFTGGQEGVHSAAYVLIAALLGTLTLWRSGWLSPAQMLLTAAPLTVLVFLFQVRTTWVIAIVYFLAVILSKLRATDNRGLWLAPAAFLAAVGVLVYAGSLDADYGEFSSGRTEAYAERVELILNRDLLELLIGSGVGSEMLTNDVWWWEAKNSHNDFLDIAIQTGIVGLAILIAIIVVIGSRLDKIQMPLFLAFVTSSLISNGLLARPFIAALLLAFLLAPPRRAALPDAYEARPFDRRNLLEA